jgi:hypothetical protein
VITRILSLYAVISLELNATSAYLHLFAYSQGKSVGTRSSDKAFSVARYALPTLPAGFTYVHAHMECSPVSLTSQSLGHRGSHGSIQDGEGILVVTLETQYNGVPDEQSGQTPIAPATWDLMTAVCRISFFDRQARYSWNKRHRGGMNFPTASFDYTRWARKHLSWLPRLRNPPSAHSICGYRLMVTEKTGPPADVGTGGQAQDGATGYQRLVIYDFSPYRVLQTIIAKDGSSEKQVNMMLDLTETARLPHTDSGLKGRRFLENHSDVRSFTMHKYGPRTPTLQQFAPEFQQDYRTKVPYIIATRTISIDAPNVECIAHLSFEQLLLVHVRPSRSLTWT